MSNYTFAPSSLTNPPADFSSTSLIGSIQPSPQTIDRGNVLPSSKVNTTGSFQPNIANPFTGQAQNFQANPLPPNPKSAFETGKTVTQKYNEL